VFDLSGKNAFITGAVSGLGFAVAQRFVSAGATVTLCDLADDQGAASQLKGQFVAADVSDAQAVQHALAHASQQAGKFDIVVNNAGINGQDGVTIEDSDVELTQRLFSINALGVYHGLKFAPAHMHDGGSIINTASLGATFVFPGSGPYSAAKASVLSLTQMSAMELASRSIRVNAVAPGFIRTPMLAQDTELFAKIAARATATGRLAEPEEVAAVYHFLAADDSVYVNGQVLNVDGGMSLGFSEPQVEWMTR